MSDYLTPPSAAPERDKQIVIDVWDVHAYVSRWRTSESGGFFLEEASNEGELAEDAAAAVYAAGGSTSMSGRYPCPPDLAARARWDMDLAAFAAAVEYPADYIEQHAAACDEIMERRPGETIKGLLSGAEDLFITEKQKALYRVLFLPASWCVFLKAHSMGFDEWQRTHILVYPEGTHDDRVLFLRYYTAMRNPVGILPR